MLATADMEVAEQIALHFEKEFALSIWIAEGLIEQRSYLLGVEIF